MATIPCFPQRWILVVFLALLLLVVTSLNGLLPSASAKQRYIATKPYTRRLIVRTTSQWYKGAAQLERKPMEMHFRHITPAQYDVKPAASLNGSSGTVLEVILLQALSFWAVWQLSTTLCKRKQCEGPLTMLTTTGKQAEGPKNQPPHGELGPAYWTEEQVRSLFQYLCKSSSVSSATCGEAAKEVAGATHINMDHMDDGSLKWSTIGSEGVAGRLLLTIGPLPLIQFAADMGASVPAEQPSSLDNPIGALAMTYGANQLNQNVAFVHLVAAFPRGRGIGSALMRKAEELASTKGCTQIILRALDESLINFYAQRGYVGLQEEGGTAAAFAAIDGLLTGALRRVGAMFGIGQLADMAEEGSYMAKDLDDVQP